LDLFIDEKSVLRVGGRLKNFALSEECNHPAIIPHHQHVTDLIVRWCHQQVQHAGRGMTLNEIRLRGFWLIASNTVVRKLIFNCVVCRSLRGKLNYQKIADLPEDRVSEAPPFTYCGVDLFGPFLIKEGRREMKRYGCLFTCLSCRAIHIETTNSADTDAFINALRRFIARRGNIRLLRSDNGTNFVGAENELLKESQINTEQVKQFLLKNGSDFVFQRNPPYASHMGGVWERQIRTVRDILASLLKQHSHTLDDELFRTLLTEVESIVNCRPLTVETLTDKDVVLPLSPNQLLTMKTKVTLPLSSNFEHNDLYCRRRWRRVQHLANEFWSRWKKEYLSSLQTRPKHNFKRRNFQIGDIVLLKEESLCRNDWPMAKVVGVKLDDKGECVRTVHLKLSSQDCDQRLRERPVNKIVLLLETATLTENQVP
jgi:hypothetical protein